jgi:hypothetical protein
MTTRRKYNWPELFKAFDASGLNQSQFCKQHDLNPKYFSNKRSQLLAKQARHCSDSAFQKVSVRPTQPSSAAHAVLALEIGQCKLHIPHSWSLLQTAELVKALA